MCQRTLTAFVLAAMVVAAVPTYAQSQSGSLAGCLIRNEAQYTLGEIPSGNAYELQGNTSALVGHTEQLVRLAGSSLRSATSKQAGAFSVTGLTVLADTCTALLPPQNAAEIKPVTGTTAPNAIAVNVGMTANRLPPSASAPGETLRPPNWNEIGQNELTAGTNAAAVLQTEQYPYYTLGVNAMPSYTNPQQPQGKPATQVNTQ
jgi:hypothetical protein